MQFASIQKAIQRNCYRLWSAQWQLLLGVTACLTKLTPIIVLPRMSGQILQQIVSWLGWPLINWRFSQAIDVLQTYKLSTPESTAIDLSASEFIVEERKNQQHSWNSFDVAIDLSRDKLVEFALKPQLENVHRQLLAPEIRSAAAITSILMNSEQDEEKSAESHTQTLIKLFNLHDIAREIDKENVNSIHQTSTDSTLKNAIVKGFTLWALPKTMQTTAVQRIVNQYAEAYKEVKENLAHCNNLLGYLRRKMSTSE